MEYIPSTTKVDTTDYYDDMSKLEELEYAMRNIIEILEREDMTAEEKLEEIKYYTKE